MRPNRLVGTAVFPLFPPTHSAVPTRIHSQNNAVPTVPTVPTDFEESLKNRLAIRVGRGRARGLYSSVLVGTVGTPLRSGGVLRISASDRVPTSVGTGGNGGNGGTRSGCRSVGPERHQAARSEVRQA